MTETDGHSSRGTHTLSLSHWKSSPPRPKINPQDQTKEKQAEKGREHSGQQNR